MDKNSFENIININVIPLRGLVVFPEMTLHFDVGRKKSVASLKDAMNSNQKVFLVCQKDASVDDPSFDDIYEIGVICKIKQMLRIPNSDNLRVTVEGISRGEIISITQNKPFISAAVSVFEESEYEISDKIIAYSRAIRNEFEYYSSFISKLSSDVIAKSVEIQDGGKLADYICSNTFIEHRDKQEILSTVDVTQRLSKLFYILRKENKTLEIEQEIQEKVQEAIDKNQKEYFLREEMKVISDQLGEGESPAEEADEYRNRIKVLDCSSEVKDKLLKECEKLMKMPPGSHEATVVRNYLDKCLEIPFGKFTKDSLSLKKSRAVLDKDHYGLDDVKTRIVDALAVLKRNPDFSGQIICLAGPPGVGKTSIVKSLAKSMKRKYVRVALGGIHDEAEIRGHRKTYIGAMPGRIIDAVIKSGVMNPIILLDEIDKLGTDYKGDPSSALLEALDPEQNNTFTDHYIDFPVDLSKVLFITTANDTSTISAPLYDRMEVIELNSYTAEEKFQIAKKHLVKKETLKHKLSSKEFKITDDAIYTLIESYTKEAGVRKLEKQIATLCRKAISEFEDGSVKSVRITNNNIEKYLGVRKYIQEKIPSTSQVGVVNGLAWTSVGGTLLPIEVSALDGTGKLELTGNLGDVMKESAKTAVSYVRSKSKLYGIDSEFYKNKDIHIHAPEGAIPKDGPSAGLAITTAIVSELTGVPIKNTVAMTGEISLKGKAMAIGGLKEKTMAAYKAGCSTVIIPKDNEKDLEEISKTVKESLDFITVEYFDNILDIAFDGSVIKNNKNDVDVIVTKPSMKSAVVTQ